MKSIHETLMGFGFHGDKFPILTLHATQCFQAKSFDVLVSHILSCTKAEAKNDLNLFSF